MYLTELQNELKQSFDKLLIDFPTKQVKYILGLVETTQ